MLTARQKALKTIWAPRLCKNIGFPDYIQEHVGDNAIYEELSFGKPELTIDFYYPKQYGMLEMVYFHQAIISDISPRLDSWYLTVEHRYLPVMPIKTSKVLLTQYTPHDYDNLSLEGLAKEDIYIAKYRAYHVENLEDISMISMFSQNYSLGQDNLFLNESTLIRFCEGGFIVQFSDQEVFSRIKNNILKDKYGIHEEWAEGNSNAISTNCFNVKSLAGIKI